MRDASVLTNTFILWRRGRLCILKDGLLLESGRFDTPPYVVSLTTLDQCWWPGPEIFTGASGLPESHRSSVTEGLTELCSAMP